jgi:hypothetical protein
LADLARAPPWQNRDKTPPVEPTWVAFERKADAVHSRAFVGHFNDFSISLPFFRRHSNLTPKDLRKVALVCKTNLDCDGRNQLIGLRE